MKHFLSFDVEDVYQSFKERGISGWQKDVDGEKRRIIEILDLLDEHSQTATFFILTEIINDYKSEILEIKARGHEIASHGHEHLRIWRRSRSEFDEDIRKSKDLLENLISSEVIGYRAPGFSLQKSTHWASDYIREAGFKYSSSASTMNLLEQSESFSEFPATSVKILGREARICGGFYFRALPFQVTKSIFRASIKNQLPVNVYLHPFEFEEHPKKINAPRVVKFVRYHNLEKTKPRLVSLLEEFTFSSFEKALANPIN